MATIQFKGKSAVWNHHLSVPYHTLEEDKKKSLKGKNQSDNLIIQGDNLLALKSLLPMYQGRIKCIYIDPPYNTGNEGWKYNDKVNSPTIKDWVGKTVGRQGEDLTRHDKWLCMMTPRLKLLRELLAEDGAIFISIDDNEQHYLRSLMDEIFKEENFIAYFIRQGIKGGTGPSNEIRKTHDYVLAYAKNKQESEMSGLELDAEPLDLIDEKGPYRKGRELNKWGAGSRREDSPTMWFPIIGPSREDVYPIRNDGSEGRWRWGKSKLQKAVEEKEVIFEKRKDGTYIVYEKVRDSSIRRKTFSTLELTNAEGTEELKHLFDNKTPFNYPKPISLVKFVVNLCANSDGDIVLDSFAGSGTTAHAVLDLSKEDGVDRKFILIEMEDYANDITAERTRRAVKKYIYDAGFNFSVLGPAIDAETLLSGKLPTYKEFAKYVYYLASGKNHPDESKIKEASSFVGKAENETIYLVYKQDMEALKQLAVTLDWAQETHEKNPGKKIVYAPACYLDEESMERYNVHFVSIPYNLFERKT